MTAPALTVLEQIAFEAGDILRQSFGGRNSVDYKSLIDLVTDVDRRSEAYIIGEIQKRFPDHHILAEESGETEGDREHTWYVDPLDGTVNYAHGIPIFTVSLAYAYRGEVQMGVVYGPMLDECFSAQLGKGAWLNGQPVHVAQASDLDHSLLTTGFPYDIRSYPTNLEYYRRFALLTQGVRRLGSAALDLCYVAAGKFDGYWEAWIQPWDVAAGVLIAQEGGAVVTRMDGSPFRLRPPLNILAANTQLHPLMLAVIRE
jgi:myo-inositol-1(or 4)-monophosphatase